METATGDSVSSPASRRDSSASAVSRRPSETSPLPPPRRESSVSTVQTNTSRRSSVFANQGEWKAADSSATVPALPSAGRKSSLGSLGSRRPSVDGGNEISFGNGEYTSVSSPRRASPSPNSFRRPSTTSAVADAKDGKSIEESENVSHSVDRLKRRTSSNAAGTESQQPVDEAIDKPSLKRQGSDKSTLELPPLPPSSGKRLTSLIAGVKPKMPSKLRSIVRRTSGEKNASGDDQEVDAGADVSDPQSQLSLAVSHERELSGHYNEYEASDLVLSPGRSRIYTIEQARRSSFLPVNRIKNESSSTSLEGGRRSVRLSEADVGLILGKVSKISAETLRQAAMEGNSSLCEALVRSAVAIDDADINGKSALMIAAEHGRGDTTEHLLTLGATVDVKDDSGMTALHFAVRNTKVSCVKALINSGADCNIVANGESAFTVALQRIEQSLALEKEAERKTQYTQTSEVCRVMLKEYRGKLLINRDKLKKSTLFLLDEWVRAKSAGEELVVPPMDKLVDGERSLIKFLKEHRQRVNFITAIKIWFVVVFIGFDLATRDMTMTPARILTYVFLYVGAYYL